MGFTPAQARKALRETDSNMERAVDWLFSHPDETGEEDSQPQQKDVAPMEIDTGSAKFKLLGFIVHLGASTHSGHYVAYLHKDGQWIQFNDRKVSKSVNPPIGSAYLYFFERL
jgi:ubiquitin carboxyl-terminal hydrolase 5/13